MPTLRQLRSPVLLVILWILPAAARADSTYITTASGSFGVLDFGSRTYTPTGSAPAVYSGLGFDAQDNLYAVEVSTSRFFKVNAANGNGTAVGSGTGVTNWVMAGLITGELYEIDRNSNLYSLNPTTGAATLLGRIGLPAPSGSDAGGLAGTASVLYYTFNDPGLPDTKSILYKIDPANCCAAQRIGSDAGFDSIGAVAYVNDTLYGFDNAGKNVLKIDTTTGVATVLFPFPGALANDKVSGAVDVTLGQRLPGRFVTDAVGGQMIALNIDGSVGYNIAPYDFLGSQSPSQALVPSVARNGTVAFASGRAGGGNRVFVMNGDGTNVRQITFADSTGADDRWPAISPDGTKVAFISRRVAAKGNLFQKLFVVNVDGTGMRQVEPLSFDSNGNSQDTDSNVAWGPDSKKLAFRGVRLQTICNPANPNASFQEVVGTVNLDGTGEQILACNQAPHGEQALDWSPDGNLIAYGRPYDAGGPVVISLIDPQGNSKYALTLAQLGSQTGGERGIHFSPDSTRLAYRNSFGSFNGFSIINLNGTGRIDAVNAPGTGSFWWASGSAIPKPAQLTLAPDPVRVWPGHTQQLLPSLLDAAGNVISHAAQAYIETGPYCASIDPAGLVGYINTNTSKISVGNGGLTSNSVTVQCLAQAPPQPLITLVANAAGEAPAIAQNTWIEIKGSTLAPDTRTWQASDFVNNQLPTQLDGVSVTVNGKSAYVYYISDRQVNVLTPLDPTVQGVVQVLLTNSGSASAPISVPVQAVAPAFFVFGGGPYAAATHADGRYLGPTSLYPGQTTPAKPGEVVVLYANGFGQTSPAVVNGSITQSGTLPVLPVVSIGGIPVAVDFAGVVSPGLYQFNVHVPDSVRDGDNALMATYNGFTTQSGVSITVQH